MTTRTLKPLHYIFAPGQALCAEAEGFDAMVRAWGQRLTAVKADVTCPSCLNWLHA